MTEKDFLGQVNKRLAQIAVGASALRNQGAGGVIKATRGYLETGILLDHFFDALTDEKKMNAYLDTNTINLVNRFPDEAKSWGAARKALNLFFREVVYNKFMADHYNLPTDFIEYNKTIQFLEVPLDSDVATGLYKASGKKLSKWKAIKELNPTVSKEYQDKATEIAKIKGIVRVHLDLEYWRKSVAFSD